MATGLAVISRQSTSAIRSAAAIDFAKAAKSENTQRSYRSAWSVFANEFCADLDYKPLPIRIQHIVDITSATTDR